MFVLPWFSIARYLLSLHLGMITPGILFQYLYLDHSRVYAFGRWCQKRRHGPFMAFKAKRLEFGVHGSFLNDLL